MVSLLSRAVRAIIELLQAVQWYLFLEVCGSCLEVLDVSWRFFRFWEVLGGFKEEDQHCRKPRGIINYFWGSPGFSFTAP